MVGRLLAWMIVASFFVVGLASLVSPARASSEDTVTVRGSFVFKFFTKGGWEKSCFENADGSRTCTIDASGAFYGGITGDFVTHIVVTGTPVAGRPFAPSTATALTVCDPCSIAGRSGSVTFDSPYVVSSRGFLTGTLTVVSATGELEGVTGTGTYIGTSPDAADPYVMEIALPS